MKHTTDSPLTTPTNATGKYSQRIARKAHLAAAAALTAPAAMAAVETVNVDQFISASGSDYVSFDPLANDFVLVYDASYSGIVRYCGLNFISTDTDNFQWSDGAVQLGSLIDSDITFSSSTNLFYSVPADGVSHYQGYRLENAGDFYYGYMAVSGTATPGFNLDFYSFNNDAGEGITVVPEPAVSALLLGVAAILALKVKHRIQRNS